LALDGNPIFHHKGYFEFCLNTCPNLKHLDLRKITPEMRDSSNVSAKGDKVKSIEDSNHKSDNGNVSTDISPDK
jgi:hypothetical protein